MDWHTLAGPKHIYSTVARNSDDRLELFALTEDGSLQHCWQMTPGDSVTWSEWQSLGKGEWDANEPGTAPFAVGLSNNGCLEVIMVANGSAPDEHGQIFHNRQCSPGKGDDGGEWAGWHGLDAQYAHGWSTTVGPTVVRGANGLLNLFVMSANRGVLEEKWWSDHTNSTGIGHYRQDEDGRWNGPELRMTIETCIEVDGRPDYSCKSKLPTKLAAALNSDGRLELFANAGDLEAKRRGVPGITYVPAHLWHARQTSDHGKNWGSGDFPMPPTATGNTDTEYGAPATQPSVVLNHEGNLEVYVWGNTDHYIWLRKQDPTVDGRWLPWRNIGGAKEWGPPVIVGDQNNLLTVLAPSMTSNSLWYLTQFLDSEGRAVWPTEWRDVTEDGDVPGTALLHAITNQDGRVELFGSGSDGVGFSHKYQVAVGEWS